jgi:branched-chain amino acid aminotransferase
MTKKENSRTSFRTRTSFCFFLVSNFDIRISDFPEGTMVKPIKIAASDEYLQRMLSLERPGAGEILAFYEHRVGLICRDPKLMLLPLDDHIVHRGDGIFETMKYEAGRIYQLDAHLERLVRSAESIFLTPPVRIGTLREIVLQVCAASGTTDGVVSIFVGRGPGGFTTDFRECPVASLYVVARTLHRKPEEVYSRGVTAFRAKTPAKQCYLARIKSVDYLPNVLMKREAVINGYDFPLCFDEQGFLAEGSTENVLAVDQAGTIVVPDLCNALPGTTLMRGLELIREEVPFVFRQIREEELSQFKELVLVGTTLDALSIVRFNGKPVHDVRPGPVSRRMRELFRKDIRENGIEIGKALG